MVNSTTPLVSVIMPVYNGERYLAEAIESILTQTYSHLELIVLNNGSTDGTAAILDKYVQLDKRVRLIYEPVPLGYGGEVASNIAARKARGQFIAKLDADDIAKPNRLARQVAFLQENPNVFLVGSYLELIDSHGNKTGIRTYPLTNDAIYQEFYLRFPIANPSVMYRNVLNKDLYIIRFPHFNDYYSLFLLINSGFYMQNLAESLTAYRIHTNNTVFTNLRAKWQSNLKIKQSFVNEYGYSAPWIHRLKIRLITQIINQLPERLLINVMNSARKIIKA